MLQPLARQGVALEFLQPLNQRGTFLQVEMNVVRRRGLLDYPQVHIIHISHMPFLCQVAQELSLCHAAKEMNWFAVAGSVGAGPLPAELNAVHGQEIPALDTVRLACLPDSSTLKEGHGRQTCNWFEPNNDCCRRHESIKGRFSCEVLHACVSCELRDLWREGRGDEGGLFLTPLQNDYSLSLISGVCVC